MPDDTPKAKNYGKGGNLMEPPPSANGGAAPLGDEINLDMLTSPPTSPPTSPLADDIGLIDEINASFDTADSEILLAQMDAANKALGSPSHSSPLPTKKPNHDKSHNRMVSWGGVGGEPPGLGGESPGLGGEPSTSGLGSAGAAEDLSIFSGNRSNLQTFLKANPFESEAEAFLQRTLDETDPTVPGPSDAQKTILGAVPQDASAAAFDFRKQSMLSNQRQAIPKSKTHQRNKSTAESLFSLAADFENLEQKNPGRKNSGDATKLKAGEIGDFIDAGLNSGDKLARHGAVLIKRHRLDSTADATNNNEDGFATDIESPPSSDIPSGKSKKTDAANPDSESQGAVATDGSGEASGKKSNKTRGTRKTNFLRRANNRVVANYKDFEDWLVYTKGGYRDYIRVALFYLIIPLTGVAAILFYLFGNPPCGTTRQCITALEADKFDSISGTASSVVASFPVLSLSPNGTLVANNTTATISEDDEPKVNFDSLRGLLETAAYSWWLLFVVRQIITFSLANVAQAILIEYLALRSKVCVVLLGPFVTLFLVQSKGWPMLLFLWALADFFLLYGDWRLAAHWLYFQDVIALFSESNPGGRFTSSGQYRLVLIVAMVVAVTVAVKRFWLGLFLGRQTFLRYADDLAKAMQKALLIGNVAALARDIEQQTFSKKNFQLDSSRYAEVDEASIAKDRSIPDEDVSVAARSHTDDVMRGIRMNSEQKVRIHELLGAWEEPEIGNKKDEKASIGSIIQFRSSLSYLNTSYPFGAAFGPAGSRKECIASVEDVFRRLMLGNNSGSRGDLHFNAIAGLAVKGNGKMDEQRLKSLIKLFRPDRDGMMSLLVFAKAIDGCYKELRLLRASVASASRMDRAFEGIINFVFYFIMLCIVLSVLGIDPFVLFASISGFVLGFAFMIGSACSKYFEGLLFILIRHPYDVGDRIAVSDVNSLAPGEGSPGWIVKDVDLFTTTVLFATTNEVATYSNGSLANSRIINMARSPKANLHFLFKFPIDTPYDKIKIFHGAIENFVKARPREYTHLLAFRITRVEADQGFVEYIVFVEHRERWQNTSILLTSKAELSSFALELMKKMKIQYHAPPMPIEMKMLQLSNGSGMNIPDLVPRTRADTSDGGGSTGFESVEAMFKR